jgi:RNA polymerase sigma factor (sigma-70 family)
MQPSFDINIPVGVWEKFREGDSCAFSEIYHAYAQAMFAYGCCLTGNRDLIQDCIHEVFIKFFNHRKELQRESVNFYLIKALRNELWRAYRDEKDTVPAEENEDEFTPVHSTEDLYIEREEEEIRHNTVQEMLSMLTPNQREAVHYRYIEERSLQEIADIMGINYQSVQNLIQRSIQKIREKYKNTKGAKNTNFHK